MTPEIVNTLALIAEGIGQLEGVKLVQPSPILRRKNRIQTIQATLAIEGNSLTRGQVTALLEEKRVLGPQQDILEVQNAIAAYRRLANLSPTSINSFSDTHRVLMRGLMEAPGSFRKGPIGVLREKNILHQAPPWKKVEPMMDSLFDYLRKTDDHPLIKSSRFHFQLEHIHPFIDGNGRMGRLWQTVLLMAYHPVFEFLPVEDLIRLNQRQYYRALAEGEDAGDCTGFVVFILQQLKQSLQQLIEDTRGITHSVENRLGIAQTQMGDRRFSRQDYQKLHKTISAATASRDLQRGVKSELLERSGDKRTSVYQFKSSSDRQKRP